MIPYTGEYIEHIDPEKPSLRFYSFTPPLDAREYVSDG